MTEAQISALASGIISALVNMIVFGFIPLGIYLAYQRRRHKVAWSELRERLGLVVGERRYLAIGLGLTVVSIAVSIALAYQIPSEFLHDEHSPHKHWVGAGFSGYTIALAFFYAVIQTGLSEEIFFRGLVAGSLGRRLPLWQANIIQAVIFLLPHLPILLIDPGLWWLAVAFPGSAALVNGWLRIKSGSILTSWMMHASANFTVALTVMTFV